MPLCAFGLYVILGITSLLCGRIWCHIRPLHLFVGTTYVREGLAGSPPRHGPGLADGDGESEQGRGMEEWCHIIR